MSFKQLVLDFTYLVSLFRNDRSDNSYSWMAMISMLCFVCSIRHWFNVTFRISYPRIHGLLGNLQVSGIICKISRVHTHCDGFFGSNWFFIATWHIHTLSVNSTPFSSGAQSKCRTHGKWWSWLHLLLQERCTGLVCDPIKANSYKETFDRSFRKETLFFLFDLKP